MPDYASIGDLLTQMPTQGGTMGSLLDHPDIRRQRAFDMLGGLGAALIQAGAPSPYPNNFGGVLGAGLAGAAQAGNQSEDRYLKRALVDAQVQKAHSDIANEKAWADMFKGPAAPPATAQAAAPPAGAPTRAASAIGGIESGGQPNGGYGAVGPVANAQGNRAYGKYQVLDSNIGPWTQEILGKQMTPQEFLANPQAQDQVFQAKFGQYVKQHGSPEAASRAWFAGPAGMNNPNATDVLGTTVQGYGNRFAQAYGPGATAPPGVAQGDASGNPVQPAQYQAARPQTMQEVIDAMPPGVRQMVGAMGRKDGMAIVMKYADPGSEAVLDTQTGAVVFVPKTLVGRDPRFQPVEGAKLEISRGELANKQRKTDSDIRNSDVIVGPDGRPMVNQQAVDAKKAVSAAQGSGALEPHADKVLIDQAAKEHGELQGNALKARTGLTQVSRLSSLLDQVNTGRFTSTTQDIKQMAKGLGIDLGALGIKDDVGPAQAAEALSNQFALLLRDPSSGGGMPGALSDSDRKFLAQMVPNLETTPEGRKLMVDFMSRMYQRQIDLAKVANQYVREGSLKKDPAGMYAKLQEYADTNPIFDPAKDAPAGGMSPMPAPSNLYDKYGLKPK